MRSFIIAAVAALAFATTAGAQGPYHLDPATHHCEGADGKPAPTRLCVHPGPATCNPAKSKPCGKGCIARDKVCNVAGPH
jgi:hypothetical protein